MVKPTIINPIKEWKSKSRTNKINGYHHHQQQQQQQQKQQQPTM